MHYVAAMFFRLVSGVLAWVLATGVSQPVEAREQIRIVGSATVYPFITAAAEQFGLEGNFKTPIVEATGTGGGFKLFCSGTGLSTPDFNNASRRITVSEIELCNKNAVGEVVEIPLGYDGIVLVNQKGAAQMDLSYRHIFLALARELPDARGELVPNPNRYWSDVDKGLPQQEIRLYGPPPTSGTRDTFVELAMEQGCEQHAAFAAAVSDPKERKKKCKLLREDGRYVEAGENYNIIVQKLIADPNALGLMGFGFFDENAAKVQAAKINRVSPTHENIAAGRYGLARTLYLYVKKSHLRAVPGIGEFVAEVTSDGATGESGYLAMMGLVPLNTADRQLLSDALGRIQ